LSSLALSAFVVKAQIIRHESAQIELNDAISEGKYLIKFTNGELRWVTESEKWQLRGVRPSLSLLPLSNTSLGRPILHGHNQFPIPRHLPPRLAPQEKQIPQASRFAVPSNTASRKSKQIKHPIPS